MKNLLFILTLVFSSMVLSSDIITDNSTNEDFCSKFFYGKFVMAKGPRLFNRKKAKELSVEKLESKFLQKKEECEINGNNFRNCPLKIRSTSPRRRWQFTSSFRYSCL